MNILVTLPEGEVKNTFIPGATAEKLEALGQVTWNTFHRQFDKMELREKLRGQDICITGWGCPKLDEDVLGNADKLKLVVHTGGSVAPIVSSYLYEKGIKVISGNKLYAESVAEGVLGYILCSLRGLVFFNNELQAGSWRGGAYNEGLLDQTVGLVGFGMVAKYLAGMLKPFRAGIRVYDPYITEETCAEYGVECTNLEDLITTSKIISLHAPKIPETYHMIDKRLIRMIPDGALLVNTARGALIDEEALAGELRKNRFKAVLDVFEVEPLPVESGLRGLPNVILIPHMAGPTVDRRKIVTEELIKDMENFWAGKALKHEISNEYAMKMTQL